MDSKDSFIFEQDDLLSLSFNSFTVMREKGELVDFTINFENHSFVGHRLVLAAAIPHFHQLFTNTEEGELVTSDEVDADVLGAVIDFAYSGRIEITTENVRVLVLASKYYQLPRVNAACWKFLEERLDSSNAWEIRTLAKEHQRSRLQDIADSYIRQNFEEYSKGDEFLVLPFSALKGIINSDVKVCAEKTVYEAVLRWVKLFPSERKDFLPELLSVVRMQFLTPEYLIEKVSAEELVRSSMYCRDLVEDAKNYHLLPDKRFHYCPFPSEPRQQYGAVSVSNTSASRLYAVCSTAKQITVKLLDSESGTWSGVSTWSTRMLPTINVAACSGRIYIFQENAICEFDVYAGKCNEFTTADEKISGSSSIAHKGRIYFFGGSKRTFFFGGSKSNSDRVRYFDPQLNKWFEEERMKRQGRFLGVSSLMEFIYITGGLSEGGSCSDAERYNTTTREWTTLSPMCKARYQHGCASLNDKIYVCGGLNLRSLDSASSAEVYDTVTDRWTFISPMKVTIDRSSAVSSNGRLYQISRDISMFDDHMVTVQIYDPHYDEWKLTAPLPVEGLHLLSLVNLENSEKCDNKGVEDDEKGNQKSSVEKDEKGNQKSSV